MTTRFRITPARIGSSVPARGEASDTVGAWHGVNATGPESDDDWADVEAYMGLLERVNVMIDRGLIDGKVVDRLYGYRVANVLTNQSVVDAKLHDERESWTNFIALAERLGYRIPPPS